QTFRDFEIIISDNGSTDDTCANCERYAAADSRINYYRQSENRGPAWNFNFVCDQSTAPYFMWAACDDRWDPRCLELYAHTLETDPGAHLVFCSHQVLNHVTGHVSKVEVVGNSGSDPFGAFLTRLANPASPLVYGMFRKSWYSDKVKAFEEIDFWD